MAVAERAVNRVGSRAVDRVVLTLCLVLHLMGTGSAEGGRGGRRGL